MCAFKSYVRQFLLLVAITLTASTLVACGNSEEPVLKQDGEQRRLGGKTMGTSWSVVLGESVPRKADGSLSLESLQTAIEVELTRINQLMSTWDPDSELSRFNAAKSIEAVALHADTLAVIDAARLVSQRTQGRYDITLAEVIALWGFGPDSVVDEPDEWALRKALSLAGHHQLVRTGDTVRKRHSEVTLDVSSLAKGYAVDQIGRLLELAGVAHYVAEIGGELRVRGFRGPDQFWQIGVEHPDGTVPSGLALSYGHVATSGSYRNYQEIDGKRLSHIIDGHTGRPIEHALAAVTVLHDSTLMADAWATALLVMGEDRARELSDDMNLAVQLTSRSDDGFVVYRNEAFSQQVVLSH